MWEVITDIPRGLSVTRRLVNNRTWHFISAFMICSSLYSIAILLMTRNKGSRVVAIDNKQTAGHASFHRETDTTRFLRCIIRVTDEGRKSFGFQRLAIRSEMFLSLQLQRRHATAATPPMALESLLITQDANRPNTTTTET